MGQTRVYHKSIHGPLLFHHGSRLECICFLVHGFSVCGHDKLTISRYYKLYSVHSAITGFHQGSRPPSD